MQKYTDSMKNSIKSSGTCYRAVGVDSSNLLRDSAVDRVYGINSTPLAFIETKDGVQGGKYCFRGTRVPISNLKRVIEDGVTYTKMAATLKKYFNLNIKAKEIESALREYNQIINRNG